MNAFNVIINADFVYSICEEDEDMAVSRAQDYLVSELSDKTKTGFRIRNAVAFDANLMNTTNGHQKDLVDKINVAYHKAPRLFHAIVLLLSERDRDEFDVDPDTLDRNTLCFKYCMHIADDTDLETIINYCKVQDGK